MWDKTSSCLVVPHYLWSFIKLLTVLERSNAKLYLWKKVKVFFIFLLLHGSALRCNAPFTWMGLPNVQQSLFPYSWLLLSIFDRRQGKRPFCLWFTYFVSLRALKSLHRKWSSHLSPQFITPKLLLMSSLAPCMAASAISVWMCVCEWILRLVNSY